MITERNRPIKLVECRWSDADVDGDLICLRTKFPLVGAWEISVTARKDYQTPDGIWAAPAMELLRDLV